MVGKRGQFTISIVLGFVLISSFAFLLFARSIVVQDKLRTQADMIVQEAIRSSNINFYVKSCLDRVVDDAVYLLSLQGGKLYKNQGGSYPNPIDVGQDYLVFNLTSTFYNISFYNYTNVSYGILPNFNSSCVYPSPPSYPFPNTSIDLIKWTYHNKSSLLYGCSLNTGALGVLSLPPLCDPNGTNRLNASGQDASLYRFGACKFGYGNNSVQEQLQTYISNSLKSCVNFSIFENIGYNVTVLNDPNSTVTLAEKYFVTNATYPFLVKLGRSKFRTYADFELKKNVRLKQVYEYIQRLLEQEYKNIHFNIESDYRNPRLGWDTKITLIRAVNPCKECGVGQFDDIFQLVDNESLIGGNPLIFQFAVKNRAPVLDWIHFGMRYNIVVKEGQDIRIDPFGLDPDENFVVYNYSGWMEEFNSSFNEVGCEADPEGCRANPSLYVGNQPWNKVRNWTNSELFQETRRNASYRTSRRDLGLHYTLVHVKDEGGLEDYQNISIMVGDIPVVVPSGDNIYDDISSLNASIEDPYILNALARSYFTDVLEFKWQDTLEPFTIFTTETEITLPYELDPTTTIEDIDTKIFKELDLLNPQREITLKGRYDDNGVERWTDPPSMMVLDVHECLPHINDGDPWPYPYNTGDEFQASHACCDDGSVVEWGKILSANTNTNCFEYTEYGSNISFLDINNFYGNPSINPPEVFHLEPDIFDENDIIKREIFRLCDGSRGNICNGSITDMRTKEDDCDDYTDLTPSLLDDERCSGPEYTTPSTSAVSCFSYGLHDSFEKLFSTLDRFDNPSNGICNEGLRCATGEGGLFKLIGGGNFKCKGLCNGGGCDYPAECVCGQFDDLNQNCGASPWCDDKLPGTSRSITGGLYGKTERGCSNTCQELACSPYIFQGNSCRSISTSDSHCDDDYYHEVDGNKCIRCDGNSVEKFGKPDEVDNLCESDPTSPDSNCNADLQCDEKEPNKAICSENINTGGFCSSFCLYQQPTNKCDSRCPSYSGDNSCNEKTEGETCDTNRECNSNCECILVF
ncbi:MAG: hypothetical protein ISS25_00990 [Nanoarchaeota archaeon]|nr:hypothetical protein [DPANN group archaeon]MBL7116389.1 hypothetical protein [Nanoarchaeota archaeon]